MSLRILFIWCTVLFCGSHAAVPLTQFFGYGPEHGDQQLSREHQQLPREYLLSMTSGRIDSPFTMFGKMQEWMIVDDDGVIGYTSGRINVLSGIVDLQRSGQAYWRKSNKTDDLDKARQDIGSAFPAYQSIDLKWTLIATWYKIAPFQDSYDAPNTFQAVLTTDGTSSFAIFYYNDIGWMSESPISRAGFEWNNDTSYKEYFIRGTKYGGVSTLANRSNVYSPGKWIFQIDQPTIYEPNPLCEVPPQPKNGLCKAEEFVPDSLAQCSCKLGYKSESDIMEGLKCSPLTDNRTVGWTGNFQCCPTQIALTPCDCTNSYIDHRLTLKTAYEFKLINDTKRLLSKRRQRIAKHNCIDRIPKCLIDINDVCDELLSSAICINGTRLHYYDEHEQIFHIKIPKEWQNNTNCQKAMDVINTSDEMLEPKECPSLPIPEHGLCASLEKKPYLVGSVAHCKCLPNYWPVPNTNCNSRRECRRDQDGNLYWSGKTPVCELLE